MSSTDKTRHIALSEIDSSWLVQRQWWSRAGKVPMVWDCFDLSHLTFLEPTIDSIFPDVFWLVRVVCTRHSSKQLIYPLFDTLGLRIPAEKIEDSIMVWSSLVLRRTQLRLPNAASVAGLELCNLPWLSNVFSLRCLLSLLLQVIQSYSIHIQ